MSFSITRGNSQFSWSGNTSGKAAYTSGTGYNLVRIEVDANSDWLSRPLLAIAVGLVLNSDSNMVIFVSSQWMYLQAYFNASGDWRRWTTQIESILCRSRGSFLMI